MAIDRRKLLAFGGLGAIGAGTGLNGPEIRFGSQGLTIHIIRGDKGWFVAVPEFNKVDYHGRTIEQFNPARELLPIKTIPLDEFLKALDDLGNETV